MSAEFGTVALSATNLTSEPIDFILIAGQFTAISSIPKELPRDNHFKCSTTGFLQNMNLIDLPLTISIDISTGTVLPQFTKNNRTISSSFRWSCHFLVMLSHFSGVVMMISPFLTVKS
jgi:hypothetical protein